MGNSWQLGKASLEEHKKSQVGVNWEHDHSQPRKGGRWSLVELARRNRKGSQEWPEHRQQF